MEETYCSDEIEVVLVDNTGPGPMSTHLDDSDTVKIIITMSCDPQTAAQLEESVKQSLLENAQVRLTWSVCIDRPCGGPSAGFKRLEILSVFFFLQVFTIITLNLQGDKMYS